MTQNQLKDSKGNRLYLIRDERAAFLAAAAQAERITKSLCMVLHFTGCRISEALEITPRRIDLAQQSIRVRTLKKRDGKIIYRDIPVPPALLDSLNDVFGIREIQKRGKIDALDSPLWPITRVWAWHLVKGVMTAANISEGPHRTPKGLRHGYGVNAMQSGIQLNMLQKWMGHADMETTAIYANALGEEERQIAARMWS